MKIYVEKFGGASVNSADAVKNVLKILSLEKKQRIVVISAMGKTTNKLERIVNLFFNEKKFDNGQYEELIQYHNNIIDNLFSDSEKEICKGKVLEIFSEMKEKILRLPSSDYNFLYDSIVSYGERISTLIVSEFLNSNNLTNSLIDSRHIIKTDNNYRDANIQSEETRRACQEIILPELEKNSTVITQGFVGGSKEGLATTLGREGSDYSASVIAYSLGAESLTIWKDVSGLLNADPKRISNTKLLRKVPYREAIELSYYGATIIHPKTIKPLENLSIPLYIKSFLSPQSEGTVICAEEELDPKVTNFIFKDNQVLLSVSAKDFSFIAERNIASIFSILAKHKVKVNLIQNSAISFSVCFDENNNILPLLLADLQKDYTVKYNTDLQLITLRHYTATETEDILKHKKVLIEQKSRTTAQYLVMQ
ncbi:MAG: aspartate kinase [Bacteroidales bacterium]|nr:aspartate kinase [Bacteroidales bacterium]